MVVEEIPPFYVKRFDYPEKAIYKCNELYSHFLEQVRCILILLDDVAIINQDLRSIVRVITG